jgi:hypothetical protein
MIHEVMEGSFEKMKKKSGGKRNVETVCQGSARQQNTYDNNDNADCKVSEIFQKLYISLKTNSKLYKVSEILYIILRFQLRF